MILSMHPNTFDISENSISWHEKTISLTKPTTLKEMADDYLAYENSNGDFSAWVNKNKLDPNTSETNEKWLDLCENAQNTKDLLGDHAQIFAEIYSQDTDIFDRIGKKIVDYVSMIDSLENIEELREDLSKYSEETITCLLASVDIAFIDRHLPGCLPDSEPWAFYGHEEKLREQLIFEVEDLYGDEEACFDVISEIKATAEIKNGCDFLLPDDCILCIDPKTALDIVQANNLDVFPTKKQETVPTM